MKKLFPLLGILFLFPLALKVGAFNKAFFSFSSPDVPPRIGQTFEIAITLNTDGADVRKAEAVITFDPAKLTVTTISPGAIFSSYPQKSFSEGTIRLAGEMAGTASFSGIGKLGTITFQGKSAGTTTLSFSCTPGETNESNIIQAVTNGDIIDCGRLSPLSLTILSAIGAPATTPIATATPPPSGYLGPTFLLFLPGCALLAVGIFHFYNLKYG